MIAVVTFYPTTQGTNEEYQREMAEQLNELLNQGYEVKAHSDWVSKSQSIVLLLHKKDPGVIDICFHCGGLHQTRDCPIKAEVITP